MGFGKQFREKFFSGTQPDITIESPVSFLTGEKIRSPLPAQ